jgi:hypothetical protein
MGILTGLPGCRPGASGVPGEVYDAGYVMVGTTPKMSHDFAVRNTTGSTVEIIDVGKTCGCTSYELARMRLAPGE